MKMCAYCGNQVDDKKTICSYCNKGLGSSKNISFYIRSIFVFLFLSVFVVLIIALPALYIMSKNHPLMFRSNKSFCRDKCGIFSYKLLNNENYCVCNSGDVYDTRGGSLLFNKNNFFNDKFSSYMGSDLSKFDGDLVNGDKIVVIIQDEDNYYFIEQLNSIYNFSTHNNLERIKLHYIDPDKLSLNDENRIKEFVGEKITSSNSYLLLIDNGEVIYSDSKSFYYYDSSEISSVLFKNSFIDIER